MRPVRGWGSGFPAPRGRSAIPLCASTASAATSRATASARPATSRTPWEPAHRCRPATIPRTNASATNRRAASKTAPATGRAGAGFTPRGRSASRPPARTRPSPPRGPATARGPVRSRPPRPVAVTGAAQAPAGTAARTRTTAWRPTSVKTAAARARSRQDRRAPPPRSAHRASANRASAAPPGAGGPVGHARCPGSSGRAARSPRARIRWLSAPTRGLLPAETTGHATAPASAGIMPPGRSAWRVRVSARRSRHPAPATVRASADHRHPRRRARRTPATVGSAGASARMRTIA